MNPSDNANGSISGQVLDLNGKPVEEASVLIVEASPPHLDLAALTNATGWYSFQGLTPGNYTLLARATGFISQTRQIQVGAAGFAHLNFSVYPERMVSDGSTHG